MKLFDEVYFEKKRRKEKKKNVFKVNFDKFLVVDNV